MAVTLEPSDVSWIREAVEQFQAPLTLYAAKLLGNAEEARDVVQETFLRLCKQDKGEIQPRLAEWLFTVCRNRALDVLRKESRMTQLTDEQVHASPGDHTPPDVVAERNELSSIAMRLLDALPNNQRDVIRLKFQNGFSYQEISRITGHSVSNVGYLIHMGMKSIRAQLVEGRAARA
jgi:RNA polymerase sigma-70 factor (ECF subfamily)